MALKLGACPCHDVSSLPSRDRCVRYNFLQLSAIFGVVTGLQHAVVKQIIRLVFRVVRPLFQNSLKKKNGTKKEEADEAVVLVSF